MNLWELSRMCPNPLKRLVGATGIEPVTPTMSRECPGICSRIISAPCAQRSRHEALKVQEKQVYRFTRTPKHYASWGFWRIIRALSRAMRGMSPWR